uniref:photosystem I n=1 Tax=Solanum lycopersicum TaxID=4081 RepID=A0A3Q7J784_SOLLC
MVRDYDPTTRYNDLLDRVLRHLFHSFGLYIHNDTMRDLGRPQDMFSDTSIQLQPVFIQWIQNTHALAPGATASGATTSTSLTWGGGDLVAVGGKVALLPILLGTTNFFVHHIHACTTLVTVLILLKGVLFAPSSCLILDKENLGFYFPCDGPGRMGTYQVSTWDHIFLGLFWMYNSISVGLAKDPTTHRIWFGIATAHDFESHDDNTEERLSHNIFASHFGQLAIIFLWTFGNLFHVAWQGILSRGYKTFCIPIAHAIFDPHFGQPAVEAFTQEGTLGPVNIAYSGVYQWWYTISLHTIEDLYTGTLFLLFLSAISLIAGWLHLQSKWKPSASWFKNAESCLNHHLSGLFGISSLAWTGHFSIYITASHGLGSLFTGQLNLYGQNPDSSSHLFGTVEGAGTAILTLLLGFHSQTQTIAFVFLVAGHMYRTNFGIGNSMKDLLDAHIPLGGRLGYGHKGLYETINNSLHFQLGLDLASLGVITSFVAQHMYSLPAYAFITQEFTTQAALYTHHQYIAGFIMIGAFAHGAIFFIRDYNPEQNKDNVLARMLDHREAIISHLSWASLFLGFHTLGLYVHSDFMLACGTPEKKILIEPIFSQWIQSANGKTSYGCGLKYLVAGNSLFLTIGPGDFLDHHAIALGLHTTTLILVKGALDARGSKLMLDKKDFSYSFLCDGPGRGGTCDILAWDAFYLAVFWMLNTIGWVTFYWHWKQITLWKGNVWAWMFLFGHSVWATIFMFLISLRGYWRELIVTLAWAHEHTPLANLIRWRDKLVALSTVQARLVGLDHFSVGYIFTYATFLIASTSGKFG